jgi:hypothetical protein
MSDPVMAESSPTDEGNGGVQLATVCTEMWSDILKSPENLSAFSPSEEIGGENLHGIGKSHDSFGS